jgi:hypothetical protein
MTGEENRRWAWYQQTVDAATAALGLGIAILMAWRDSWPPVGVLLVLVCLGRLSARALIQYLVGRWENGK